MKNLKIAFLAIVAMVSFSCSDDDNSNGGNDSTYIKFKVNGEQFNIIEPGTLTSGGGAVIMATNVQGEYMMLRMPSTATEGTHTFSEPNSIDPTTYQAIASVEDQIIDAAEGTITITSIGEEYMKGTFSFTGTGDENGTAYTITDGEFRAYKPANN